MRFFALGVAGLLVLSGFGAHGAEPPRKAAEDWNCGPDAASILILGSYHMANPGQDAVNVEADDVLSARRQRELTELNARLAAYAPTMVAVEAPYAPGESATASRYARFLKGGEVLTRNEIDQIGFRIARAAGLKTVLAIDHPMWMNGWRPDEIEQPPAKPAWGPPPAKSPEAVEREARLRRSTVTEYLLWLNSEAYRRQDHAWYAGLIRRNTKSAYIYQDADLLTNWYKRNHRMMANLMRAQPKAGDRVLMLVGSGHLSILREMAITSPDLCLADTEAYLR